MAKILLVEDDGLQGGLCRRELEEEGHEVVFVRRGRDALDRMSDRPDVVVLDLRMPDIDGIDLLGRIISRNNTQPVIIHSALADYANDFRTWVADDFVVKRSDFADLKSSVRSLLGRTAPDRARRSSCPVCCI